MGERKMIKLSILENDNNGLIQIFQELPVKSLIRFKCVSKTWCLMIEDPEFVDSHRIRSHTRPGGVSLLAYKFPLRQPAIFLVDPEGNSEPTELPMPTNFSSRAATVSRHAEGLVCYGNFIWNPSTRKGIKLPVQKGGLIPYFEGPGAYSINNKYMLGFDSPSKTYKVLSICNISFTESGMISSSGDSEQRAAAQVLTLGTNSWTNLDSMPEQVRQGITIHASCYTNNVIFCLISFQVLDDINTSTRQSANALLTFEVGNERFRIIQLPESGRENADILFEVRGRFAITGRRDCSRIWVLEDYENEMWTTWNIRFPQYWVFKGDPLHGQGVTTIAPVGTIHNHEILFQGSRISASHPVFLFYYNLETGNVRYTPPLRIPVESTDSIELSKHVETVFSFKIG